MVDLDTAMLHAHVVLWGVVNLRPCATVLRFTGQSGRSRHSRTLIVRLLSAYARSEAVYDIDFIPPCAMFLQGFRKGHRVRLTGRSVSSTRMHL